MNSCKEEMEQSSAMNASLLEVIIDRINMGIFVVDKDANVVLWNEFMQSHSGISGQDIIGSNLFNNFPELPKTWLQHKIHNVFVLKNYSFTSWEHRPYLFKFQHNRPITGGVDEMNQNCTFFPILNESGEAQYVCITLNDVTDASIYERMLQEAVRSLAEASNHDGLTDVYNRRFLEHTLTQETSRIQRYGGDLSMILVDLDHFKAINDTHGHQAGDETLRRTARCIQDGLRTSDMLSRYGGEEFAVLLPETDMEGAMILAERLRASIEAMQIEFNDTVIPVTASIGVSELNDSCDADVLVANADAALYYSKENGRNQVTAYDTDKFAGQENQTQENVPREEETQSVIEEQAQALVTYITIGYK